MSAKWPTNIRRLPQNPIPANMTPALGVFLQAMYSEVERVRKLLTIDSLTHSWLLLQAKRVFVTYQSLNPDTENSALDISRSPFLKELTSATNAVSSIKRNYDAWQNEHVSLETKVRQRLECMHV